METATDIVRRSTQIRHARQMGARVLADSIQVLATAGSQEVSCSNIRMPDAHRSKSQLLSGQTPTNPTIMGQKHVNQS